VQQGSIATATWSTSGCGWVRMMASELDGQGYGTQYSSATSGSANLGPMVALGTHYYTLYAAASANGSFNNYQTVQSQSVEVSGSSPFYFPNPPRNVVEKGTVYLVWGDLRQAYTSAGAFLSFSFNKWADVVPATPNDLAQPIANGQPFIPPRDGSLINDHGTVYIIINGLRAGFSSESVFRGLGYSFGNVIAGDTSFMVTLAPINSANQRHPWGTIVNQDGTLYLLSDDDKIGIPSLSAFYSWGFKLEEVIPANSYDRSLQQTGILYPRDFNQFDI
jgi:hypothetical protein